MKKINSLLILALLFGVIRFSANAYAQTSEVNFPLCPNVSAPLKVHYDSGTHWIIGRDTLLWGSDSVYRLAGGNFTQCFCPTQPSQDGIQTNWLEAKSLTSDQIDQYKKAGWIYVESGKDFDLAPSAYLAKNSNFQCSQSQGASLGQAGGQASLSTPSSPSCPDQKPTTPKLVGAVRRSPTQASLSWTKSEPATGYSIVYGITAGHYLYGASNIGNTDSFTVSQLDQNQPYYFAVFANNNCQPSDRSNEVLLSNQTAQGIGGQVLGVSTLAPTGTNHYLASLAFLSGIFLLLVGKFLSKKS